MLVLNACGRAADADEIRTVWRCEHRDRQGDDAPTSSQNALGRNTNELRRPPDRADWRVPGRYGDQENARPSQSARLRRTIGQEVCRAGSDRSARVAEYNSDLRLTKEGSRR